MGIHSSITRDSFSLDSKFTQETGTIYLTGIQALLRVMLDQKRADRRDGLDTAGLVCGYPGSPVGGVDFEMQRYKPLLSKNNIEHIAGLNEELAATALFGTQLLHEVPGRKHDGVFGMWFGKSPGVDRAADAFHHANFHGVGANGGVLAVAGDDPHARSTILPSDSNTIFSSFYMPVLAPGNIQEVLDFGLHGYALSRAAGLWIGFKLVSDIAESAGTALVAPDRIKPISPKVEYDGKALDPVFRANAAGPPMIEAEREIFYGRLEIARRYARANKLNQVVIDPPHARLGIVTAGKTYYDLREALENLGLGAAELDRLGIRILKIGMVYPFDPESARAFARGLTEIIVIEDKRPFLELFIKDALYGAPDAPRVIGKQDEKGKLFLTACGEISTDIIASALRQRLSSLFPDAGIPPPPAATGALAQLPASRIPYFCSGCPHNRSLRVPDGSIVGAGIGCHIMTLWMGPVFGDVIGYTQMGGEGAQWVGLSPFSSTKHYFQNIGDGTFAHSGSLAVRFAVAAKANITYKLLYNSAVAMTGGQSIMGGRSVADIVAMLAAEGVRKIIVTTDEPERYSAGSLNRIATVRHRDDLVAAEKELAETTGVTVLINDQQCAAEKRRLRKRGRMERRPRTIVINERVCEGCGDCGVKSNCLSVEPVETEFGRKTAINQTSCNQDYSCLLGDCPSFLTVETSAKIATTKPVQIVPPSISAPIPEPVFIVPEDRFSIFMTGIGGTGVVTVNQILGTAAAIAGRAVRGMDQTGSSQKAGPVVSHLHVEKEGRDGATRVMSGSADLFLAFDMLTGAEAVHLRMASPDRTVLIASTSEAPTGEMVTNKNKIYPNAALLRQRMEKATRADADVFLDARNVANTLFGSEVGANMVLVGAAYQAGALPIPAADIERAIRLNNVSVDMNIAAFRSGRMSVHAPEKTKAAMMTPSVEAPTLEEPALSYKAKNIVESVGAEGELRRLLVVRTPELIAFQDARYAADYAGFVRKVRETETKRTPGRAAIAEAVAANLYKLMAYKDEYEVARLMTSPQAKARLYKEFGTGARVSFHLHPTFLRSLGFTKKVRLGPWFAPLMRMLAKMKALRGTPFDLFARTHVRRTERNLIVQYRSLVEHACDKLDETNYESVLALAKLPDVVRGYEDVKLGNIELFREQAAELAAQIGVTHDFGAILRSPHDPDTPHMKRAA